MTREREISDPQASVSCGQQQWSICVVQWSGRQFGAADHIEASVEEICTQKNYSFRSEDELLEFLAARFA